MLRIKVRSCDRCDRHDLTLLHTTEKFVFFFIQQIHTNTQHVLLSISENYTQIEKKIKQKRIPCSIISHYTHAHLVEHYLF